MNTDKELSCSQDMLEFEDGIGDEEDWIPHNQRKKQELKIRFQKNGMSQL